MLGIVLCLLNVGLKISKTFFMKAIKLKDNSKTIWLSGLFRRKNHRLSARSL